MACDSASIVFGPVPSRRLGRSLGVNNIPRKTCTYACAYCQAGSTTRLETTPRRFYDPVRIAHEVRGRLELANERGERIDYVSFVPDGEPTLDVELGRAIDLLKQLGVRAAVITNASLLWQPEVRKALERADWVSLKVDTVQELSWRRLNRPSRRLSLDRVLQGHRDFAACFRGTLVTETMLVHGINDERQALEAVAEHVSTLKPNAAWLAVPVRPPAQNWVRPPNRAVLEHACEIFGHRVRRVGFLTEREPDEFGGTGDIARDLLAITAVHPLSESAVVDLVRRTKSDWSAVETLVREGRLAVVDYGGERFYRSASSRRGFASDRGAC
jgi:wyosine [tRNA(Phe)-imidazoG37] synthetase (radical SAM superfamily)